MEPVQIEATDRYGGHSPSWLRACHDECEAMGYIPVSRPTPWLSDPGRATPRVYDEAPRYVALWVDAHAEAVLADPRHDTTCDGSHFVMCPTCHGTGRVALWRSIARLPIWIVRGIGIIWNATRHADPYKAPWTSRSAYARLVLDAAFLNDLGANR